MAAILCGGISKCLNGFCDCVNEICRAPCRICNACCDGCSQCCQGVCKVVGQCCASSFCVYIVITCALNIPPIVLGVVDLPNLVSSDDEPCHGSYWLLILWILCVINILASFYMSWAVNQDDSILPQQKGFHVTRGGASRMKHLFCYDGFMAVYILIVCAYIIWLCLGAAMLTQEQEAKDGSSGDNNNSRDQCDGVMGTVGIACSLGWAFLFCGGCTICCTLCCGVCK